VQELYSNQMMVAHLDDTLIKKTGKKIAGTAWRRDPLGPPFHTNFIWGQRFLQISMALPGQESNCQSKAIPIDFYHCPTVKKPNQFAGADQLETFKQQQRIAKLSYQGSLGIQQLRNKLNAQGEEKRQLVNVSKHVDVIWAAHRASRVAARGRCLGSPKAVTFRNRLGLISVRRCE